MGTNALRYQVPEGEDPAAVIARLRRAGYEATFDHEGAGEQAVLVSRDDGSTPDRDQVRDLLTDVHTNLDQDHRPVSPRPDPRFDDEG